MQKVCLQTKFNITLHSCTLQGPHWSNILEKCARLLLVTVLWQSSHPPDMNNPVTCMEVIFFSGETPGMQTLA